MSISTSARFGMFPSLGWPGSWRGLLYQRPEPLTGAATRSPWSRSGTSAAAAATLPTTTGAPSRPLGCLHLAGPRRVGRERERLSLGGRAWGPRKSCHHGTRQVVSGVGRGPSYRPLYDQWGASDLCFLTP